MDDRKHVGEDAVCALVKALLRNGVLTETQIADTVDAEGDGPVADLLQSALITYMMEGTETLEVQHRREQMRLRSAHLSLLDGGKSDHP